MASNDMGEIVLKDLSFAKVTVRLSRKLVIRAAIAKALVCVAAWLLGIEPDVKFEEEVSNA